LFADENQDIFILKTLILKPGDVIELKGGWGAVLGVGEYGHTGMYLGKEPESGKPVFLDFTTTKKGRNPEFRGRISSEEEFLNDNIGHKEFNVYRLNSTGALDQKKLLKAAQDIAKHEMYGATDCVNAAAKALSIAANLPSPIVQINPNGLADDFRFDPSSLNVNIKDALDELKSENDKDKNAKASSDSFFQGIEDIRQISPEVQDTFSAQEIAEDAAYRAELEKYKQRIRDRDRIIQEQIIADSLIAEAHAKSLATVRMRFDYLREMTGLACSNPDVLEKQGQLRHVHDVSIEDIDLAWMMNETEMRKGKDRPVVNSCQKYLLTRILETNGRMSGQDLLAWARFYRKNHPSLLTRFATTTGDMFVAMGKAFGNLLPNPGSGSASSGRGSSQSSTTSSGRGSDAQAKSAGDQAFEAKVHEIYWGASNKSWDGNSSSKVTPR